MRHTGGAAATPLHVHAHGAGLPYRVVAVGAGARPAIRRLMYALAATEPRASDDRPRASPAPARVAHAGAGLCLISVRATPASAR